MLIISCSKKNDVKPEVNINGTTYPTVKIGTQTWTAANYNGPGGENYDRGTVNDPLSGKFYSLDETTKISLPAGWRVPTREDAEKLLLFLGAKKTVSLTLSVGDSIATKLKSNADWTYNLGNNSSGFNAFPVGLAYYSVAYSFKGNAIAFWTSTSEFFGNFEYILRIEDFPPYFSHMGIVTVISQGNLASARFSLRFVKDN